MSDPIGDAVKVATLEGKVDLLGERITAGLAHVADVMGGVREQQGRQATKLDTLLQSALTMPGEISGLKGRVDELEDSAEDFAAFKGSAGGSIRTLLWAAGIIGSLLVLIGSMGVYVLNVRLEALESKHNNDISAVSARLDRVDGRGNTTPGGNSQ